jgi:CDP-diacylglycerol--glycerol-3-phosphate 3-phosphatidyltransferase
MTDAAPHATSIAGFATPANAVTVARILLSPLLFLAILESEATLGTSWTVVALGLLLAASDVLDGRLARHSATVSRSGAFLDPLADKIVVLGAMFCLVAVDRYQLIPVALIAFREIGISVWRVRFARSGLSIPARPSAKLKTLVQAVAIGLFVLPLSGGWLTTAWVIMLAAVVLTVITGIDYFVSAIRDSRVRPADQ